MKKKNNSCLVHYWRKKIINFVWLKKIKKKIGKTTMTYYNYLILENLLYSNFQFEFL